jgi:hypothetical protein
MSAFTDDDLETAAALRYSVVPGEFDLLDDEAKYRVREATRRILAAVAPAIAARALREAARDRRELLLCAPDADALDRRADEIERTH